MFKNFIFNIRTLCHRIFLKIRLRLKDPYKIHNIFQRLKKRKYRIYQFKDQITKKILFAPTLLQSDTGLIILNFDDLYKKISAILSKNSIVLDVGGNIGYVSRAFSIFGNNFDIICLEPNIKNLSFASKNLSDLKNVSLYQIGLSNQTGRFDLNLPQYTKKRKGEKKYNTGLITAIGNETKYGTRFFKGDKFIKFMEIDIKKISYIKIDVEGFEKNVIEGFQDTLQNSSAICEVEINPRGMYASGSNLKEIISIMKNLSFIPLVESKVNDGYIKNLKVFNIFFSKIITKDKLINYLRFKELKNIDIQKYMDEFQKLHT